MTPFMSPPADAPVDAPVPEFGHWFTAIAVVLNLVCLAAGILLYRRTRSVLPLLVLPAGFVTVVVEATVAHLGYVWHPIIGQTEPYNSYGMSIPVYLGFVYAFYFGLTYLCGLGRAASAPFTKGWLWGAAGLGAIGAFVMEIPVVRTGIWIYYGPQSLWIWKDTLPVCWVFMNVACLFTATTAVLLLRHWLRGWRALGIIPLSPIAAYMGHIGAGFPWYLTANSTLADNPLALQASGVVTALLSLFIISACIHLLTTPRRTAQTNQSTGADGSARLIPTP